jgi:predicted GNAT superfamily acetyltransferase
MFILGYFDGDGGIVRDNCGNSWKITICGTADMCNHLKTIFLQFGCKPKILKIRNHYDLRICGLQNTRLFLDWLYKDAVFYMKRKHDIYLKILDFYKTSKRPYRYDTTFIEKIKNVKKMYYVDKISVGDIARKYNCTWSTARGMIDFYSYITI